MTESNKPLLVRLDGTKEQIALFVELLPILKDIELVGTHTIGKVDFARVQFFAHCHKQYGTKEKNSELNKRLSSTHIRRMVGHGSTFQNIAEWLNDNGYKTSRGKDFKRMTVKRIFLECNEKK